MTIRVFDLMFKELIESEGAYQNDPADRGNWTSGKIGVGECKGTKWGVSAMSYPSIDIKNLTINEARAIFKHDYWDRVCGDLLPDAVVIAVSDFAYNSGTNTAVKVLQKVLGVSVDGKLGNQTLGACSRLLKPKLIDDYCNARLEFLQGLRTFKKYGKGWTARVERIRKTAKEHL